MHEWALKGVKVNNRAKTFLLFLLGLFSLTKVHIVGLMSISEIFVFPMAPLIFFMDYSKLRKDAFLNVLLLIFIMMISMFVSAWWNQSAKAYVVREFAILYGWFAFIVVFHNLLRNNYRGLGWFFLGVAFSSIITIFVLNPSIQVSEAGAVMRDQTSVEQVMDSQIFWFERLFAVGRIPIVLMYYSTPISYCILAPIGLTIFSLLTTISGRSGSLIVLVAAGMMFVGQKSRRRMAIIGRHFFTFAIVAIVIVGIYKFTYSHLAKNGVLGAEAQGKYLAQTINGDDALHLLMAGRKEFFIGIKAALDKPIIGHGPRPQDKKGYLIDYMLKYGSERDIAWLRELQRQGMVGTIPTHSHIIAAWVYYGVSGLIFFIYVLWLIYVLLRKYISAIPQWFGWFALLAPSLVWQILFSPYSARSGLAMSITTLLFAKAVGQRRLVLPYDMEIEARAHD